jgi:hypothetical protein
MIEMPSHTPKCISFQPLVALKRRVISAHALILSLILVIALTMGAIGLDHGLPYAPLSTDEYGFIDRAIKIGARHWPGPGWFGNPGSTFIYPLAFLYKVWGSISYQIPIWQTNPELVAIFKEDPVKAGNFKYFETDWTAYYLIGRWLNLFFFAASIGAIYLVGRRVWDKRIALLAAWFLAITPIVLEHAQMIRTDLVGLLFFSLGFLACFRLFSSRKWSDYAIAGIAIGIAGSSRYFNLSLGATLILAHFLAGAHVERGHWKRLIFGLIAIGFGFLITTPTLILKLGTAYRNLSSEARASSLPLTVPGKLWWYLSFALPNTLTWPLWLLAIAGMWLGWWERNKKAILLLFGVIMFLFTIIFLRLYWDRWIIPLIPLGLLFAAKALWTGIDALIEYRPGFARWGKPAAILLILAVSILPLYESIRHVYMMTRTDTRTLAAQWIEKNIPAGSRIGREWYTPLIPGDFSITFNRFLYQLEPFEGARPYDYLVTSAGAYERFFKTAELRPEKVEFYEAQVKFYEKLFQNELVAEFKPDPWKVTGPTIRIYRLSDSSP